MKKEGVDGEVSISNLEARIHQAKIGWFIVAGFVSSFVSVPAALTIWGIATYRYITTRNSHE